MVDESDKSPALLGQILKRVSRKEGMGQKRLSALRLAKKLLAQTLGPALSAHADVASVRTGVATLEADSAAAFQELEGFRRQELIEAFQSGGLKVRELRVRLAPSKLLKKPAATLSEQGPRA